MPNALSARLLRNVINKTAAHHNSPTFPPHVELFSLNTDKTIEEFVEITQPVVDEARAPISLQQAGVRVGDTFHRSVYLALVPSIELTTLRSNLLNALGVPADMERPVFPHLALYYGEGSKDGKYDVVYQMMESCTVDIMKNGMIEVAGLESLGLTEMWIVDIRTEDPAGWMVLHKQALIGSELAIPSIPAPPSPVTQTNETTAGADDIVIDYISCESDLLFSLILDSDYCLVDYRWDGNSQFGYAVSNYLKSILAEAYIPSSVLRTTQ